MNLLRKCDRDRIPIPARYHTLDIKYVRACMKLRMCGGKERKKKEGLNAVMMHVSQHQPLWKGWHEHFPQLPFSTRWLQITFTYLKIYSLLVNRKKKLYSGHAITHVHMTTHTWQIETVHFRFCRMVTVPTCRATETYLRSGNHLSSTLYTCSCT